MSSMSGERNEVFFKTHQPNQVWGRYTKDSRSSACYFSGVLYGVLSGKDNLEFTVYTCLIWLTSQKLITIQSQPFYSLVPIYRPINVYNPCLFFALSESLELLKILFAQASLGDLEANHQLRIGLLSVEEHELSVHLRAEAASSDGRKWS